MEKQLFPSKSNIQSIQSEQDEDKEEGKIIKKKKKKKGVKKGIKATGKELGNKAMSSVKGTLPLGYIE